MKSQPDITIRRIAVFTGYADSASEPAFTRPIRRPNRPSAAAATATMPITRLAAVPTPAVADMRQAA